MIRPGISLMLTGCWIALAAAPPSIGVVRSNGEFRVDGSAVRGNGTLFDGDTVETAAARSSVALANLDLALLPGSRAKIYRDHTTLEKGSGLVTSARSHVIEADTLRISSTTSDSEWQVEIAGPDRVAVAARKGGAEVHGSNGILLAVLRPGMSLAFAPQTAGAAASTKLTGVVQVQDGHYLLTDTTTNVLVELRGSDLQKYVGKTVRITGSMVPGAKTEGGASQVVQIIGTPAVLTVAASASAGQDDGKKKNKKRAAAAGTAGAAGAAGTAGAAGAAGAGAAGPGAAGGLSGAVIGGIAVGGATAGTLGGLAAAGTLSGSSNVSTP